MPENHPPDYDALRKSEEYFRHIFEQSEDGILIAEIESLRFVDANSRICAMLGYSREELLELSVMAIHPEKDLPMVIDTFQRQARGEIKYAGGLPCQRKDGSIFYAYINTMSLNFSGKKLNVGIFRDVTDQLQREAQLKMYSHAFHTSMDGMTITDLDGNITYSNEACHHTYGYEYGELAGKNVSVLTNKEMASTIIQAIMTEGNWEGELNVTKKRRISFCDPPLRIPDQK